MKVNWSNYNNLGFYAPFYRKNNDEFVFSYEFNELLPKSSNLDLVAVAQLINFNYMLGDRTVIKEIKKSPFLGIYNEYDKTFYYDKIIFGDRKGNINIIVKELFNLLQEEMLSYIHDKKNIGIFLSGGMDSRVVLGILISLIKERKIDKNINIKAFTWGTENSRDVVYANKLSKIFNIDFIHKTVDEALFKKNIQHVLNNGLEFSPIHLHAILSIAEYAEYNDIDSFLAGSFGDSIIRAQFSGIKIDKIVSHTEKLRNVGKFINPKLYQSTILDSIKDVENYRQIFKQKKTIQNVELEYQIHYMRRMLNPTFSAINKNIPVYQMFSSKEIYNFMWRLSMNVRLQDIYMELFKLLDKRLLMIPYAKTGLPYGSSKRGAQDKLRKEHHIYVKQINAYAGNYIKKRLLNKNFLKYGIVNPLLIKTAIKRMDYFKNKQSVFYEEKLLWLAVLVEFIEKNQVSVEKTENRVGISSVNGVFEYLLRKIIMK